MKRDTKLSLAILLPFLLLVAYGWFQTLSDPPTRRMLVYTGKEAGWQWVHYRKGNDNE